MHSSSNFLFVIVAIAVVVALFNKGRTGSVSRTTANYRQKPVLSPWERAVLPDLLRQIPAGYHLCPQVRLADMLIVSAVDAKTRASGFNRVASKSVDFVVAHIASGKPVLIIELDDRSHDQADRRSRDILVNQVAEQAGIPIVRFRPKQPINLAPHLPGNAAALAKALRVSGFIGRR